MDKSRTVVVTGLGLVTPVGVGTENVWRALLAGEHGFREIRSFDSSAYRVHRGAEVDEDALAAHPVTLRDGSAGAPDRVALFALTAASLALADAGLEGDALAAIAERSGVAMGTTSGELPQIQSYTDRVKAGEPDEVDRRFVARYPCHNLPAEVARQFGLSGTSPMIIPSACAAGNAAIAAAYASIGSGEVDMMVVGGADAFSRMTFTGFSQLLAISPDVVRPFDADRKGMIPGEGAGFLVLEEAEAARARGASAYATVAGYGLSCDAYHMTGSHPEGRGATQAMRRALAMSGLRPEQIDYISAHGTGTRTNDLRETVAAKVVFGEAAREVPMSSIKSMIGHTMGAASAIEAAICCLAIRHGRIPPTMHLENPDPECDLDYVAGVARDHPVAAAMNNAYAFGGVNASVVLTRPTPS